MRVSDAEREPVVDRLQQAYADGKLDKPELDSRLHLAMTSTTRADLDAVASDLGIGPAAPQDVRPSTGLPAVAEPDPSAEDRVLAAVAHALGAVSLFVAALNFQLTLLGVAIITLGIGALLYAVSWIVAGVAALLALAGSNFRYPFTPRLIH
jgi:Domain of unknown function (DUF1707)